jgi:ketosteroid isomerase-like protein
VTRENPNPPAPEQDRPRDSRHLEQNDQPVPGNEIDEFFQRLPGSFRWPKPNAEAVAAAVEAIHRMSGGAAAEDLEGSGEVRVSNDVPSNMPGDDTGNACAACGGSLPLGARFCVWCGIPNRPLAGDVSASPRSAAGQHHFHHHYHHLVPRASTASGMPAMESEVFAARGRAPGSPGSSTGGRAEAGARQVALDWAQACNTKHIDDLLELYAPDATLIRSSAPPVRSLPAIREFLISLLEAGLGDVEMESLRVEVMGEIALDLGRCKMLVPLAMGKRREERGKYLIVLVKQPAGTWKIMADCWSSDLPVSTLPPEPAARKGNEPTPPLRKAR